jgi:hypothetical protein
LDYSTLGTDTVTIYVGPKRKKFLVHKKLICDCSDYFSKAFTGGFQEAEKGVMYLPEDDSETFDSFIDFIYRGTTPKFIKGEDLPLFFLAEKFCINELANKMMDTIQDIQLEHERVPGRTMMKQIYNNTRDKSKLRLYGTLCALHQTMTDGPGEDWSSEVTDYTRLASDLPEFAEDYVALLRKHRDQLHYLHPSDPQIRNDEKGFGRCFLHTHRKGEKCHLEEDE